MLEVKNNPERFLSAKEIEQTFADTQMLISGFSAHCPFWVHTSAWTGTKTIKPFLPKAVRDLSLEKIESWTESYILRLLDLCAEVGVGVVPMFFGVAYGWEIAGGYPWSFWSMSEEEGEGELKKNVVVYDLVKEGDERFVNKTKKIRDHARSLDIVIAHEPHPATAGGTARCCEHLVDICDGDLCLGWNRDDSHCREGESSEIRYEMLASRTVSCHMKNSVTRQGFPLRSMTSNWMERGMQFTPLNQGDINLIRSVEQLIRTGYAKRYLKRMRTKAKPTKAALIVEAEGAFQNGDEVSTNGVVYVRDNCCWDVPDQSFEAGMGAEK